jgi:hypothetical protein
MIEMGDARMSGSDLSSALPAPDGLSRLEARNLARQIGAAIASGVIRDTPGTEAYMENLCRTVATEWRVSQAQRDAARAAAVSETSSTSSQQAAQRQQAVQRASRARM